MQESRLSALLLTLAALVPNSARADPAAAPDREPAAASTAPAETLPDRLLKCVLGRATNLDPHRVQSRQEVRQVGQYRFGLLLPGIGKRDGPPPDATEPAEPVDPRTRIVLDPQQLTAGVPDRFDRVVDYWPDRVELTTMIAGPLVNVIIVSDIDVQHGTAYLSMTRATDVATLDLQHYYSGLCRVDARPATARPKFD